MDGIAFELLKHLITSVITGGVVSAIWAGYLKLRKQKHSHSRENRLDEIDILHQTITDLRADNNGLRGDLIKAQTTWEVKIGVREKELNDLKSEHTACLLAQTRLETRCDVIEKENLQLRKDNRDLRSKLDIMHQEIREIRGEDG